MNYTIYHGTLPNGRRKIGVDAEYPRRIKRQKLTDHHVIEVHTCIYEVSEREIELQILHDVAVDKIPYHVVYFKNRNIEQRAKVGASNKGKVISQEHRDSISTKLKGRSRPKSTCPHCDKTMSTAHLKIHIKARHEELQGIHSNTSTTISN